jgi:hypothetical protein
VLVVAQVVAEPVEARRSRTRLGRQLVDIDRESDLLIGE